jgi:hypothetical protein
MRPYGAAPVKMKNLTGQQKVFAIEMVDEQMRAGVSKNKSMEKTAGHMKISLSQMKRLMRTEEREYWLTWAKQEDRRGQEREGTVRRRGERLTKLEKGGTDRGCRRPRKRPYLGPLQQARGLVEGVKDSRTHGDREGERKKGPEAPNEGREGERSRGLNGGRKDLGSLIAVGSLIKYGGPAGPPP